MGIKLEQIPRKKNYYKQKQHREEQAFEGHDHILI